MGGDPGVAEVRREVVLRVVAFLAVVFSVVFFTGGFVALLAGFISPAASWMVFFLGMTIIFYSQSRNRVVSARVTRSSPGWKRIGARR
jgi:hypothetical protein